MFKYSIYELYLTSCISLEFKLFIFLWIIFCLIGIPLAKRGWLHFHFFFFRCLFSPFYTVKTPCPIWVVFNSTIYKKEKNSYHCCFNYTSRNPVFLLFFFSSRSYLRQNILNEKNFIFFFTWILKKKLRILLLYTFWYEGKIRFSKKVFHQQVKLRKKKKNIK